MGALKNEEQELRNRCISIAEGIENPTDINEDGDPITAFDYLADVLDIEYYVDRNKEYLGARLLVSFGGPNIWVDTRYNIIEGYWWANHAEVRFNDNLELDEACREYFDC